MVHFVGPFFFLQGFEGVKSGLAAVVTLASSVDYTSSKSSLKLLVPLVSGRSTNFMMEQDTFSFG